MTLSAELSLYPLCDNSRQTVELFIDRLSMHNVKAISSTMSTRIFGEEQDVWHCLHDAYAFVARQGHTVSLIVKILNIDLYPENEPFGKGSRFNN